MPKIKKVYEKDYTIISNRILCDADLTLKAKGLFAYMWSQRDDWDFYVTELVKHSKAGRDQVMSALDELEKHGYLFRSRNRNELGQLTNKSTWLLSDVPKKSWIEQKTKKSKEKKTVKKSVDNYSQPKSENPTQEKPKQENPTLTITNNNKDLSKQGLNLSLSKSLPKKNQKRVSKTPAQNYERDEKTNQLIFYLNQKRAEWHLDITPISKRERQQLASAVGGHSLKDIKPLVDTAVVNAERYPLGYLVTMIKNLPEAEHERI